MKQIVTVAVAAGELGVHAETVRRLLKSGELRGVKAGRDWLIPRTGLDTFKKCFTARSKGRPAASVRPGETDDATAPARRRGRPRKNTGDTE